MPSSVNPIVLTLGHIVLSHCHQVLEKYGQSLGMVAMEGREAKHIFLKKLSENTTCQKRWVEIFRHKYVMLIWLPEHAIQQSEAASKNVAFIPERVFSDLCYCHCGLQKAFS